MRNAQCFTDGNAKVLLQIAVSATSGDPVPNFMLNERLGLRPRLNPLSLDRSEQPRAGKVLDTAREYAANFVLACIDRFVGTGAGGNGIGLDQTRGVFQGLDNAW